MASIMDGVNRMTQLVGRNRMELLMFRLGGRQRFGINVFKVREVLKRPALTRIPRSHYVICGVANMRGQTIPIMDLAAAVGKAPLNLDDETFVIVTEYNRLVQGFLVSGVDRIVNMNWEEIKPPPRGMGQNYLTAVTSVDGELVEIIDVEKVMVDVIGMKEDVSVPTAEANLADQMAESKVLFVDDSSMARKQITKVMDQVGLPYVSAQNGREAWDLLTNLLKDGRPISTHITMVISDIEMPEMDGYTLTKQIKEHPALCDLYVCLHTSLSGTFNQTMIQKVGADKLLAKFDPDELAQTVLDFLATRSKAA